jgi:hypothetical protein
MIVGAKGSCVVAQARHIAVLLQTAASCFVTHFEGYHHPEGLKFHLDKYPNIYRMKGGISILICHVSPTGSNRSGKTL